MSPSAKVQWETGALSGKTPACGSALQTTAYFPEIPGPIDKDPQIEPEKGMMVYFSLRTRVPLFVEVMQEY